MADNVVPFKPRAPWESSMRAERIRGRDGYKYAEGETADTIDGGKTGRLHILEVQRAIRFMPKIVIAVVPGWDVALQVAAGSSPLATARVEALARVSYRGGVRLP